MAKTSLRIKQQRPQKFRVRGLFALQPLRTPARSLPQVRPLPDLLADLAHQGVIPGMTKSSW
jgi:small subunit ribosomal protein S14